MPTPQSEEPLVKTTLNLFKADVDYLQRTHGSGWSGVIRMVLREYIEKRKVRYNERS